MDDVEFRFGLLIGAGVGFFACLLLFMVRALEVQG